MEIIDIAVIAKDREYAKALAWAIVRNTQRMEVWVMNDFHSFNESINERRAFDVLLTDAAEYETARIMDLTKNNEEAPLIIRLSDNMAEERTKENTVYKYRNVKDMVRDIYSLLSAKRGIGLISDVDHDMDVYCFASERGGSGCSAASLDFAREMVRTTGKKVIYISLDQFPESPLNRQSNSQLDPQSKSYLISRTNSQMASIDRNERTLKQFIYHVIFDESEEQHTMPGTYLREDERGVDHFSISQGVNPLLELDADGYIRFLKNLLHDGMHQALVIDCGSQVSMQMIKAFEISTKIFIINDSRGENKNWRSFVGRMVDETARKNMVLIDNGKNDNISDISDIVYFA